MSGSMKELQEIVRTQVILASGGTGPIAETAIRTIMAAIERQALPLPSRALTLASGIRADLAPLVRKAT